MLEKLKELRLTDKITIVLAVLTILLLLLNIDYDALGPKAYVTLIASVSFVAGLIYGKFHRQKQSKKDLDK